MQTASDLVDQLMTGNIPCEYRTIDSHLKTRKFRSFSEAYQYSRHDTNVYMISWDGNQTDLEGEHKWIKKQKTTVWPVMAEHKLCQLSVQYQIEPADGVNIYWVNQVLDANEFSRIICQKKTEEEKNNELQLASISEILTDKQFSERFKNYR